MTDLDLHVQLLDERAQVPSYAHPGDAGADLSSIEAVSLAPGERRLVRTGVAIAVPDGYVGLVHPRSGLAHRHGLSIVNAPGTIDSGYRGEILVNLINLDREADVQVAPGERIAQLLILPVARGSFTVVSALEQTGRGTGGHGSTGR